MVLWKWGKAETNQQQEKQNKTVSERAALRMSIS